MKLILSSCDFKNGNSQKVILENLPKPINKCKLLFMPNEKATGEAIRGNKFISRMEEFGFARENIHVFDYYDPKPFFGLAIDVLYVSGGNTFATLARIRESGFDGEMVRYIMSGVTYIGGSAGAHIVTKSIAHLEGIDEKPADMTDLAGLGIFDGILICHYKEERQALYERLQKEGHYPVYALTDDEYLIVNK